MLRDLSQTLNSQGVLGTYLVGVFASQIPTGATNSSMLEEAIDVGFPNRLYWLQILTGPSPAGADLFVNEDGSGTLTTPTPGTYTGTKRVTKFDDAGQVSVTDSAYSFTVTAAGTTGGTTTTTQVSADHVLTWDINSRVNADHVLTWQIFTEGQVMSFSPSVARTIKVKVTPPHFEGGAFWDLSDPTKPIGTIDPDSVIDIPFDFSEPLEDISDTISEALFILVGATNAGAMPTDVMATVFVSGATVGTVVQITCRVTTASTPPRKLDYTVYLEVLEQ